MDNNLISLSKLIYIRKITLWVIIKKYLFYVNTVVVNWTH